MIDPALFTRFPLFQEISPAILEKMAAISHEVVFKQGEAVFREGEGADKLHFLLKGSIALKVNIMSKPDSVTVSFVSKPYECFGWSGMVAPHHYTASAFCDEDSSVLVVEGANLMKILTANTDAGFKVMSRIAELVSDRLRNSRQALLKTL